jgi:hypothetical protein
MRCQGPHSAHTATHTHLSNCPLVAGVLIPDRGRVTVGQAVLDQHFPCPLTEHHFPHNYLSVRFTKFIKFTNFNIMESTQIRPFQGKKLTYTPLNFNTWKPNMMNQLEANFHQLGRAIPTGEWPNYIAQFREARTIGRRNYSTTRKPVILSVNPNPLPHAPTATSLKESNAEGKDPDGDANSDAEGRRRAERLLNVRKTESNESAAPSETELKYEQERFMKITRKSTQCGTSSSQEFPPSR